MTAGVCHVIPTFSANSIVFCHNLYPFTHAFVLICVILTNPVIKSIYLSYIQHREMSIFLSIFQLIRKSKHRVSHDVTTLEEIRLKAQHWQLGIVVA